MSDSPRPMDASIPVAVRRLIRARSFCDIGVKVGIGLFVAAIGLAILAAIFGAPRGPASGPKGTVAVMIEWAIAGALVGGLAIACIATLGSVGLSAVARLKGMHGAGSAIDPQPGEIFGSVVCIGTDDRRAVFGPSSPRFLQLGWRLGLGLVIAAGTPIACIAIIRSTGWLDVLKAMGVVVAMLAMVPLVLTRYTSRWEMERGAGGPSLRLFESSLLRADRPVVIPASSFVSVKAAQDVSDFWTVTVRYRLPDETETTKVRLALLDATGIGKWQAQRLSTFITRWMAVVATGEPAPDQAPPPGSGTLEGGSSSESTGAVATVP